jgi:predicted GNAT family acetyltransferase
MLFSVKKNGILFRNKILNRKNFCLLLEMKGGKALIRKLTSQDHKQLFSLLKEEPSFNLFLIGDIEAFGYDKDFQEIWGEFAEDGTLNAVLLRYYDSYIPYARSSFNVKGFAEIMKSKHDSIQLSGKSEVVEQFERIEGLPLGKKRVMYFCECKTDKYIEEVTADIKIATIEDVDRIIELRKRITEFTTTPSSRRMLVTSIETKTGRTYYIEDDGKIVSSASTTAENSLSAMVVGVCTDENYRQKGYASAIMQKLIKDLISERKTLCLFYDNPKAGNIYKRLGFYDIGTWTMYR